MRRLIKIGLSGLRWIKIGLSGLRWIKIYKIAVTHNRGELNMYATYFIKK